MYRYKAIRNTVVRDQTGKTFEVMRGQIFELERKLGATGGDVELVEDVVATKALSAPKNTKKAAAAEPAADVPAESPKEG